MESMSWDHLRKMVRERWLAFLCVDFAPAARDLDELFGKYRHLADLKYTASGFEIFSATHREN